MAFDQPLEADRVDGGGLFSAIIRDPVVGIILWALGKDKARESEEQQQRHEVEKQLLYDNYETQFEEPVFKMKRSPSQLSEMRKGTPSLIGSETSDGGLVLHTDDPYYDFRQHCGSCNLLTKKLSWSDETGRDLVQYHDETTPRFEPSHPEAAPIRSSLSRTRSVPQRLSGKTPESRFLPKGLMQPRDNSMLSTSVTETTDSSGIESPQWGWYIRTTPPTPEMYYSSRPTHKKQNSSATSSVFSHGSTDITLCSHPNPVFVGLQDKNQSPMGWPSVPL